MTGRARSPLAAALLVLGLTAALSLGFAALGLPSAVLFGSLLAGMAHALTSSSVLAVPPVGFRVGQALIGVTIGTLVSGEALRQMADDAAAVVAVTATTIVISLVAGRLLALRRDVSPVTGAFAMVAGGASGVVAVARELGADERVVTIVQYLRVLVVLVSLPLVTAIVFDPDTDVGSLDRGGAPLLADLVCVAVSLAVGLGALRVLPLPTGALLGPFVVAAVITSAGWLGDVTVPLPLQWLAYGLIGVQVGLRFTRDSLRAIARMMPAVLVIVVAMVALTAGVGALLARFTAVDGLTAYLATTPGGLFAVLATAADSGSDVTYVMAMQLFRLLVILLCIPLLARWLRGRGS